MNPVGFEGANMVFMAPKGHDNCQDLETYVPPDRSQVISCWRLSEEELEEVKRTGVVWLTVEGAGTPPVALSGFAMVEIGGRPSKAEPVLPKAPKRKGEM